MHLGKEKKEEMHFVDAALIALLVEHGVGINEGNTLQQTPLHLACKFGNEHAVRSVCCIPTTLTFNYTRS